jgi:hypothetical protein
MNTVDTKRRRVGTIDATIAFEFTEDVSITNNDIETLFSWLSVKLVQKRVWNGKAACVIGHTGKTLAIHDVFKNQTILKVEFPCMIQRIVQAGKELIIILRNIFGATKICLFDLETAVAHIRGETNQYISCCRPLRDGSIAIGVGKDILLFKDWQIVKTIPTEKTCDIIQLKSGQVVTLAQKKEITIWDEDFSTSKTHNTINEAKKLTELTPGVVCANGGTFAYIVNVQQGAGEQTTDFGMNPDLLVLSNGMVVAKSNRSAICIYEEQTLLYSIPLEHQEVNSLMEVAHGIIAWEVERKVRLFDVIRERELDPRDCPGDVFCFLKD